MGPNQLSHTAMCNIINFCGSQNICDHVNTELLVVSSSNGSIILLAGWFPQKNLRRHNSIYNVRSITHKFVPFHTLLAR